MRAFFVGVLAVFFCNAESSAKTMRTFRVGNWYAGSYSSDANLQFRHCAANATYGSGVTVFFSINKQYQWSIAFSHPYWTYSVGDQFSVTFAIDDAAPITAPGHAFIKNGVEVQLDPSSNLFNMFRKGRELRVAGTQSIFEFKLTGTSALLTSLLECVKLQGRAPQIAAVPTLPRAPAESAPRAPRQADNSILKAEATALAANILSSAHIQGFRLLAPDEAPSIKGHARWMVEKSLFGTVNIHPTITDEEIKLVGGLLIGEDASACKGTFLSGSMPETEASVGRVFTSCQTNGQLVTTYYMAIPRKAGGAYIIATSSFGDEKPAKSADNDIRAAVSNAGFKENRGFTNSR